MINIKIKQNIASFISKISPELYKRLSYFHNRGHFPNLKKPKNISEIILSTMISGKVNEYSDYVDKLKVRGFYEELGYGEYLPKLYGVWDNPDEVNFDLLPSAFALKTNHGVGNHYICRDKKELNIEEAKSTIYQALNFKKQLLETQYNSIESKIYCEEYINDGTSSLPRDYKFMCLDGQIKCIFVVDERSKGNHKVLPYDENWQKIDYVKKRVKSNKNIPKPINLDLMIQISLEFSKLFEFVRVDFFEAQGKLYLGELTFTPDGGLLRSFTNYAVEKMGRK